MYDLIIRNGTIVDGTGADARQGDVAVGNGKVTEDGKRIALDVKAGDRILFGKYSGGDVTVENNEYVIMREEDVFAILK